MRHLRMQFDGAPPKHTAQQKKLSFRGRKPRVFKAAHVKAEEHDLLVQILSQKPKEWKALKKPIRIQLDLVYPYRATEKKAVVESGMLIPCTSRPDLDNLLKGLFDVITKAGVWEDDGGVAQILAAKWWGPCERWEINLEGE